MYFKVRKTTKTIWHPSWNGDVASGMDIALLKLEKPLKRIPLPDLATGTLQLVESLILTIVGWSGLGPIAHSLQHVDLPMVSNPNCQRVYNETILDSMLCAGGVNDVDACQGGECVTEL